MTRLPAWVLAIGLGLGTAVNADTLSGAYLAANQAAAEADFTAAARYYAEALRSDPTNPQLLEQAALAQLSLGNIGLASEFATQLEDAGHNSQVADLSITGALARAEEFAALAERADGNQALGPLTSGLLVAWARLGEGNVDAANEAFDALAAQDGLKGFALYHKALATASVGNFGGAQEIFEATEGNPAMMTRRGVLSRIEVLSQLDRNEDALNFLDAAFGANLDPGLAALRDSLVAGDRVPFDIITSARDGVAEVYFSIATALQNEAEDEYTLIYATIADYIRPDHVEATLMTANLLDKLERYDLAIEAYDRVPRDSFAFHIAELGRAEALYAAGRVEASIETLRQLAETHGQLSQVHSTLGDILRREKRFEDAIAPYDRAIALDEAAGEPRWFAFYTRGIVQERVGNWEAAEADFRRALDLNPDQPQVLNYLGYSLVEKQIKLDEALGMIETAVEKQPNSGYIVDSLGWVLYRLGRYDEAVGHMERAVELEAVDPIVNDHLGDVYWAVGRKLEAEFQWRRALSFITEDTNLEEVKPDRIRRKLEVGLDAVLEEEGAPPLQVARDDG
ncbi:tetratricopeptide TPR_2 [Pseudaestuariivita atlantica]|uniref:Tetratricopeptide TPR_2 n=2 Tax=Pseudaestuariivita atlantica TaxID=1317121 RepID=A0A0L1JRQ9_9RHOB|nr:tetratricopeptide repeat protein [Pseudaestuariivita atlantica]KNG94088.1 tetratricopeptide TPR_2 [Pseudaestuariivita atlantica]